MPRLLHCTPEGRLLQAPAPELQQLRRGPGWHVAGLRVGPEAVVPLGLASCQALDLELTVEAGQVGGWVWREGRSALGLSNCQGT